MAFVFANSLQLLVMPALGLGFSPEENSANKLGVMSKSGVTRYNSKVIEQTKSEQGFWWPDASSSRDTAGLVGADDLTDNVSWGWHHPNGFFAAIPVGAPLIDADMNIYLAADDAIRKFDVAGTLLWTYGPRGLLASAPTLATSSVRRMKPTAIDLAIDDNQVEEYLKPSWMGGAENSTEGAIKDVVEGDILKVREGMGYFADGKEFYAAGDLGEITKVTPDGDQLKVHITWKRTGHQSISSTSNLHKRFRKIHRAKSSTTTDMLVGATTSGFVFAIDLATGEEVWVTQACTEISGVKGTVTVKDGIVLVATDRCVDRYCYRHRYLINPLWPSNSLVRGLSIEDGTPIWNFKPRSPVWNFIPVFSDEVNNTLYFQDIEGSAYALCLATGTKKWMTEGFMGTYSQGHVLLSKYHNVLYVMLVKSYDEGNGYESDKACNAFRIQGIHVNCDTWPNRAGIIWALNATSGNKLYESADLPEPPASGTMGKLNSNKPRDLRLVVTLGHNCHYNAPTWLYAFSPDTLTTRWWKQGPTLWSYYCAGDKEGGDIRRALGQRAKCEPGSWSSPVVDAHGDIYVGNQVGQLQRWGNGAAPGSQRTIELLSTLFTGVAFQDQAITMAPGIMAVATCSSLIVFHAFSSNTTFGNETWKTDLVPTLSKDEYGYGVLEPPTL